MSVPCSFSPIEVLEKGICCTHPAHVIRRPRSVRPCGSVMGLRLLGRLLRMCLVV